MSHAANLPAADRSVMEDRAPSRRERAGAAAMCSAAFLLVYVLTAGPMAGLHRAVNFPAFRKGVEIIYAPIVALYQSGLEPFATFLKWYIDLFR